MWIFYFVFWTAVRASAEEPLYRKIGDEVVLTPDSVVNPITNIRWKHDDNIAMQWYGDETSSYRQFKDRGSLNISTGVMTITGLTPDLSGIYTAEINTKVNSETQLLVISPVPKPSISVSCERQMTYCDLTCSGSITDAEPVTYWWTAGEKRWTSTKELRITKEEEEQWFSCILENPVSSISSEKVFNPFMSDKTSRLTSPAIGVPLAVCIIIIIIIIIIYLGYKNRKAAAYSQSFKPLWQYAGDRSGVWCNFIETTKCSVTSDVIEEQYQKNPNGKMRFAGEEYELDFKAKTKTNRTTGKVREIRRVLLPPENLPAEEETGFKPQWQFKRRNGGKWHDFRKKRGPLNKCSVTNDDIQKWYREKPLIKMPHTVEGENCELDFDEMIQTNLKTGNVRKIRVVMLPPEHFFQAFSAAFRQRCCSAKREEMSPTVQESSNQDSICVVTHSNSNEVVVISTVHETSDQDLETFVAPPDPRNDTYKVLAKVRTKFVEGVSSRVIKQLLDDLLEDGIVTDGEVDSILEENSTRTDKARSLIDTVKRKGDEASRRFIVHLYKRDPALYKDLGLSSGHPFQSAAEPLMDEGWSTTLIPTTDEFWREKHNDKRVYTVTKDSMRSRVALLITNIEFTDEVMNRRGAEKDEENMEKLLTALGYEVVKYTNLTGKEIEEAVIKFSKHPKLRETDSVFVVIMSLGKEGAVLGVDYKKDQSNREQDNFPIDNIYKHLDTEHCPQLLNKPKIIIIQACRGEKGGAVRHAQQSDQSLSAGDEYIEDCLRRSPREKDFIRFLSSTSGTASYRHTENGSFFIQYIVDALNTFACKDHIEELFRRVMQRFDEDFLSLTEGQMPTKDRCTLIKKFYLFPQ